LRHSTLFGTKAVGYLALLGVLDVELRLVAFLHRLPGDVGDESGVGDEEELTAMQRRILETGPAGGRTQS